MDGEYGYMNIQQIEQQAATLYRQGGEGHQQLQAAWRQVMQDGITAHHPELAFQIAKIHMSQGETFQAQQLLDLCAAAWQSIPEQQIRALLLKAQLAYQQQDHQTVYTYISRIRQVTDNPIMLAECYLLEGEVASTSEPAQALTHYHAAYQLYQQLRNERPSLDFEIVRVALRAAEVALSQNMRTIGWHYQRQAEKAARHLQNPDLLSWVLIKAGQAWEVEGQAERALECYQEAAELCRNSPQHFAQLCCQRAWLAIWMGQDWIAQDWLKNAPTVENPYLLSQLLIGRAWLAAWQYRPEQASQLLEEAGLLVGDNQVLQHHSLLVQAFIQAQQGLAAIPILHKAVQFFTTQRLSMEAGQAHLLLAWAYAIQNDHEAVKATMEALETSIEQIGHVNHLARLYQISLPLLGGWWKTRYVIQIEATLRLFQATEGVRVYGFGAPRVYVDATELQQRERQYMSIKLLLYLLEKRRATVSEIVAALWEEADEEAGKNNFHVLMSTVKRNLGLPDWCSYDREQQVYIVNADFPDYYDGADFNQVYQAMLQAQNPGQGLAQALKLLDLYDEFARPVEGEAFEEIRRIYDARYDQVLYTAQDFLAQLTGRIPAHWQHHLLAKIKGRGA